MLTTPPYSASSTGAQVKLREAVEIYKVALPARHDFARGQTFRHSFAKLSLGFCSVWDPTDVPFELPFSVRPGIVRLGVLQHDAHSSVDVATCRSDGRPRGAQVEAHAQQHIHRLIGSTSAAGNAAPAATDAATETADAATTAAPPACSSSAGAVSKQRRGARGRGAETASAATTAPPHTRGGGGRRSAAPIPGPKLSPSGGPGRDGRLGPGGSSRPAAGITSGVGNTIDTGSLPL